MGFPLLRMDPNGDSRLRIVVIFPVSTIFRMTAILASIMIIPAASMVRKNATGGCEQGDNAH